MSVHRLYMPISAFLFSLTIVACGAKEEAPETPVKEVELETPKPVNKEMSMKHSPEEM